MSSSNNTQSIEKLTTRYTDLNEKRIGAQRDLSHAESQLSKLKEEARANWGTDDLEALEKMLNDMRISNEKKLTDYQAHLDAIEGALKNIEESEVKAGNP